MKPDAPNIAAKSLCSTPDIEDEAVLRLVVSTPNKFLGMGGIVYVQTYIQLSRIIWFIAKKAE